jgi:hypothetical protein
MGQATRTTKLLLDLGKRKEGGANSQKRAALEATCAVLNTARAFYLDFFSGACREAGRKGHLLQRRTPGAAGTPHFGP